MLDNFKSTNNKTPEGNPSGGDVTGVGLLIEWQDGPLGRGDQRKEPNGAFVETVIAAAAQRIEFYEKSKFACIENEMALSRLKEALWWLNQRSRKREQRKVEGTHSV
jgi:hypothetical protein